ncbi:thioredoxin [Candidatus Nitrosotenuis sp. DW1]|uniref:thioredoxin n=1 Tax=Candidatus Nitrosotenuis sp. DW1 TaxID=2259672 RepID=UPI0015C758BE|nr:thioredoxin [Candidatus Nitrosotenuis sp. DW1]QLH10046.1 thioredoxin [Candidatus Nitrosotenuis sp. DW1]
MLKQQSDVIAQAQISVIDLDQANFDQTISGGLVLVDFWAEWCGPCKSMHPIFDRMSKKYRHVKFARVNVDRCQDIAMRFAVQSIPTFIMFKNGQPVDRMVGAVGEPGIHMIAKKYQM